MATSKLARSIEKIVTISSKGLGTLQVNVDKILWGNPNPPKDKKSSAEYKNKPTREPKSYTTAEVPIERTQVATANQLATSTSPAASGLAGRISATPTAAAGSLASRVSSTPTSTNTPQKSLQYKQVPTKPERTKPGQRLVESGLFNALDVINSVDLCNVLTYAFDNINAKKQPRPDRAQWSNAQTALYTLQDQAAVVVTYIDKYTAYPNVFIGSYIGVGPNAVPPQQAVSQSNAPTQGGTSVQKYNMYYLLKGIGEVFSFNTNTTGSLFTSQDATLLREVPGLGSNLNIVNDILGNVNKYADYRQISTPELLLLQNKIGQLRTTCVTIQNLNFKNAVALAGNFLGVDVRSEVQKLSEFIDLTKLIPTLKEINNAIRSFIRIANQIQTVIQTGQFIIKLAILFIKVFKFIIKFFITLPLPSLFTTVGIQQAFRDAKDTAKNESDGAVRVLKSINALLAVATSFVRYLVVNASELLRRLDLLLLTLEGCQAMKDSDVLDQLKQTRRDLNTLLEQLATYIIDYDSKTDPDTALFGAYEIRIIDEEVTDLSVTNRRRRGIALDQNGAIVTQSDLTFATNPQVIIGEVKQKLVSLRLVRPEIGAIDADALSVISDSLTFLDNNDVLQNDLNITPIPLDSPDNTDENQGLGLNAFINNLKGGKKLRQRTRRSLAANLREVSSQIRASDTTGRFTQTANSQSQQANQLEIQNLKEQINEWKKQIAVALTQGPAGYIIVKDRNNKIKQANLRIQQLQRGG